MARETSDSKIEQPTKEVLNKKQKELIEKTSKALVDDLLKVLKVDVEARFTVTNEAVQIDIDGPSLGILIGRHGENLDNLQLLVAIMINRRLDGNLRLPVVVDAGGWRKSQEDYLRSFVNREIGRLPDKDNEIELPPMPPAKRRLVHLLVGEHEGLESRSEGEEPYRRVVVRKVGG